MHFTNKLDFDKEGFCRIEHYGDLLFRLYLVVKLPKIDLRYKTLSILEVCDLNMRFKYKDSDFYENIENWNLYVSILIYFFRC